MKLALKQEMADCKRIAARPFNPKARNTEAVLAKIGQV
jgi:hypothetical protein